MNVKKPRKLLVIILAAEIIVTAGILIVLFVLERETKPPKQLDWVPIAITPRTIQLVDEEGRTPVLTQEQQERIEELEALGYLAAVAAAPEDSGIRVYDAARACNGYNVVCPAGTHALLIDMEGRVLHKWSCVFTRAFPDVEVPERLEVETLRWRFVRLLEGGGLIALHEGLGIMRLKSDSTPLWGHYGGTHHHVDVMPDGRVVVLSRAADIVPRYHPTDPILQDFITLLEADGRFIRRVPILQMLENSDYADILKNRKPEGDILHSNTCNYLDGSLAHVWPLYAEGNVLTSMRELDTIAIVNLEQEKALWAKRGPWKGQHMPSVMDNGHMLIFDNLGLAEDRSRVLEYDPVTDEIVWTYGEDPAEPLFTKRCGHVQPLPNGNRLITESEQGRVIEVTPDKQIVWEYVNPQRFDSEEGPKIGVVFTLERVPAHFCDPWLDAQ